ncbi:DUF1648 domain-containing protein [Nocardioides sp. R-C-SC26]|uniref:DUF1648 domain-containing protein n=1 Tax=Nocardioides sp. R-C-SC26 TaxID=2870414 RepID=UPI001E345D67|nr:DUF1648 domain-containing protein [Nocardioides sp. R-C-SC26]
MVRRAFAVSCAAYVAAWVLAAVRFPAVVPMHFDVAGEVDRTASRGLALFFFAVLGVAMGGLMAWLGRTMRSTSTAWMNVPHKDWWTATPDREQRMRTMMGHDLWLVGTATMTLLTTLLAWTALVSRRADPSVGPVLWIALGAYLALILGYSVHASRSRYRPQEH